MKSVARPVAKLFELVGINPLQLIALRHYPRFRRDLRLFCQLGGVVSKRYMILSDLNSQAASMDTHYFHQDLIVAKAIAERRPRHHIDIGSRVDGFVSHVASFRTIEIIDIRQLADLGHENIIFRRLDFTDASSVPAACTDSLSSLSVLEHIGLGRYGDSINPTGHINGLDSLVRMLEPNGTLYISFPIGARNEVYFNAHRIFHPQDIFNWSDSIKRLRLERFDYVDDQGKLHRNIDLSNDPVNVQFGCGIYTFVKIG